jgi:hypothetical protein
VLLDDTQAAFLAAADRGDHAAADALGHQLDAHSQQLQERLTAPGALHAAALWYAAHGVAVFPLQPRGKVPAIRGGFHAATTDPTQVDAWWQQTPAANIGAPTGRTFDVIDIDGPPGVHAWTGFAPTLPALIGHVLTPRPGGHHLYVPPTGLGNKASIFPSVDYRGNGGFIVMPPSITDIHGPGRMYSWLQPLRVAS